MTAEYYVARTQHNQTCIVVPGTSRDRGRTCYIPMDPLEVGVKSLPAKEFQSEYEPMLHYPVKRAAELYLYTETFKTFAPEARRHLERIVADPAYSYDAAQFKPIPRKQENVMSEVQQSTATVKKSTAPVKAAKPEAAAKAPAKKASKPEVAAKAPAKKAAEKSAAPVKNKVADKKEAAPAKDKKADKGAKTSAPRAGKFAETDKIVVLAKENPKRANTKAYDNFELYKKSKTVGDFVKAGGDTGYMGFDHKSGFIKVGQ
jgi:hypothetical protein